MAGVVSVAAIVSSTIDATVSLYLKLGSLVGQMRSERA